jgi:hypothetical protein
MSGFITLHTYVDLTGGPYKGESGRVMELLSGDRFAVKVMTGPDKDQQGTAVMTRDQLKARPHRPMEPIPIRAAEKIAKEFGYDQVVIYARRVTAVDNVGGEHMTTYGITKEHCGIAARMGDVLKKFMGWNT